VHPWRTKKEEIATNARIKNEFENKIYVHLWRTKKEEIATNARIKNEFENKI